MILTVPKNPKIETLTYLLGPHGRLIDIRYGRLKRRVLTLPLLIDKLLELCWRQSILPLEYIGHLFLIKRLKFDLLRVSFDIRLVSPLTGLFAHFCAPFKLFM